jgi:hypothetical protein
MKNSETGLKISKYIAFTPKKTQIWSVNSKTGLKVSNIGLDIIFGAINKCFFIFLNFLALI